MATQVLVIDPEKLIKARGGRTRQEVVSATSGRISEQQLFAYENGLYRPKPENLSALLEALGVELEQVASPINPTTEDVDED